MQHDIVIRGGEIVDGTGAEPVTGDLAVKDGVIVAVGEVDGRGAREIDARGLVVSPGFVDIHTHLDAQIGWDPDMTPVSWHGVTTALIGNCGVTFAPCRPDDREFLAGMMETVEDIPKDAILSGLAWDWEEYGDYLDSIERLGTAINVAGLVGHSAVRTYVMGERAYEDHSTEQERARMAEVVGRALDRGAFGFSTNRFEPHKGPDGRSIPGTFAEVGELTAIAGAVAERDGLMQAVGADFETLRAVSDVADGRVLFSYGTGPQPGDGVKAAENLDALCAGRRITAISHVRGSGFMFGLQASLPLPGDTWEALREQDFEARVAALENDETRATLLAELRATKPYIPPSLVYPLGDADRPDYTGDVSLKAMADAAGEHWGETFVRLTRASGGRALFNYRMFSTNVDELANLYASEHLYPGLGDAGAHVSQIMDAGWSSFILAYWARERGRFSIQEAIRRMTSGPAQVVGLRDRGVLAPGMRADVNVFDTNAVGERQPVIVHDFPGGAPRFIQRGTGYRATLVNGVVSLEHDELTGDRAGRVLRHGA
jgi:N-acyl-D-aspartate/D-glutamate deacylase